MCRDADEVEEAGGTLPVMTQIEETEIDSLEGVAGVFGVDSASVEIISLYRLPLAVPMASSVTHLLTTSPSPAGQLPFGYVCSEKKRSCLATVVKWTDKLQHIKLPL
jgi:hypothetical protein